MSRDMNRVEKAQVFVDLLLVRLYKKLRSEAEKMEWDALYDMSQDRLCTLEDEIGRLTGKRGFEV